MPKRNYQFEKRQKELDKQRKKEEKQQRKQDRAQNRTPEDGEPGLEPDAGLPPATPDR